MKWTEDFKGYMQFTTVNLFIIYLLILLLATA